mmetsp:Transcript_8306/g.14062  ORF Transcript_8306/g.14062 Transcript_8306/m.14062 type:complete len:333 (-) Transcript_8306:76-1074(-)
MLHRRTEKTDQQEPPGNTAYENNKNLKLPTAQTKQGWSTLLKISPYVIICILFFDRYRTSSSVICQHPDKDKAAAPSTTTSTAYDSKLRLGEQKQQQKQDAEDDVILQDKILNNLQVMDWEIPSEIKEERHKECDGRKTSSTGGFCLTTKNHIGGNWMVDTDLGNHLRDILFKGMNVVDLGAGLGHYGKIFREEGSPVKSWVGFDGAMNVESATDGLVRFMDLTQPHPADERPCVKGDWVLSLEVAEHIPPQFTDHYIRNLRCSCTVGAVVSWAVPAQTGGLGHVNCKEEKDAIAAMERWGFVVDRDASDAAQAAAGMSHFKRNTLVYRVKK